MRILLSITLFILTTSYSITQNHITWSFKYEKSSNKLVVSGVIDEHWHVYSNKTNSNAGPIPVTFNFEKNKYIKQNGKPEEIGSPLRIFDQNFDSEVFLFENSYRVEIPFKFKKATTLKGIINYMVCDDKMCLPPIDVHFSIDVNP